MAIFALGDLHLSGNPPIKPMDCFCPSWNNHWEKIRTDWLSVVSATDTVLIAGDISWAMKWQEASVDLAAIDSLPGRKVLVRGNHDYWWSTVGKMTRAMPGGLFFLQNNFFTAENWGICGSRGWITPGDPCFRPEDESIYRRELMRVRFSLEAATKAGLNQLILLLHYPPVCLDEAANGFTDLMEEFAVKICIYGHIHGAAAHMAPQEQIKGTACHLVACDALDFKLKRIL